MSNRLNHIIFAVAAKLFEAEYNAAIESTTK
jgi:hypothetical protein